MKKLFFTLLLGVTMLGSNAQISAYPAATSWGVEGYSLPRTVVIVNVTQEREVILRGPYARYASQYLGVSGAPLSDRESYKILSTTLSYTTEPDPRQVYALNPKGGDTEKVFDWIEPTQCNDLLVAPLKDKDFEGAKFAGRTPFKDMGSSTVVENEQGVAQFSSSAIAKSEEQMAQEAAQTIFKLRKRRIELITGEQGENVFGEGLKYALKEISRLEKEYVELFLGKRIVQVSEHKFALTPKSDTKNLVAFRFTSTNGVVDANDLTASPINLEFSAVEKITSTPGAKGIIYRVPQITEVKLSDGIKTFAALSIPIYQMGAAVTAPIR